MKFKINHKGILTKGRVGRLLFLLVVFLTVLFFVLRETKKTVSEETEVNKLSNPSDLEKVVEKCYFEDKITYKFYKNYPDQSSEIQKNIGYKNNKFGLYVYSTENFIKKADELVNSNGGDYGYVLIPYNVKDYDNDKWVGIFELLGKRHLIPIIQLWDVSPDNYEKETVKAARFLNGFSWPIEKKFVSAYNEMNDARFWKGKIDPEGYAKVLDFTIKTFKSYDKNFYILNGAFNSTAPTNDSYLDQVAYMERMDKEVPGIFKEIDGWASHSYPQPAFTGKPTDSGRGSIRGYEWELGVLKNNFSVKDLPVFITETGWPHAEGKLYNYEYYSAKTVSEFMRYAFEKVWLPDDRVVAVTPFTIYYDPPFDHFSWVKKDGSVYPQFEEIVKMPKVAGLPPSLSKVEKEVVVCP